MGPLPLEAVPVVRFSLRQGSALAYGERKHIHHKVPIGFGGRETTGLSYVQMWVGVELVRVGFVS